MSSMVSSISSNKGLKLICKRVRSELQSAKGTLENLQLEVGFEGWARERGGIQSMGGQAVSGLGQQRRKDVAENR